MSGLKMEAEAGVLFEVCSRHDIAAALKESLRNEAEVITEGNNFSTDASGNVTAPNGFVYTVPVGKNLLLQRLICWADGSTPRTPMAVGWWALLKEGPQFNVGEIVEFAPAQQVSPNTNQSLPFFDDFGLHNAPRIPGGSDLWFYGQSLTANINISVNFQGLLVPVTKHGNKMDLGPFSKNGGEVEQAPSSLYEH